MTHKNEFTASIEEELDKQIKNLLQKGYPQAAGMTNETFVKLTEQLKNSQKVPYFHPDPENGRLPFVIVVRSDCIAVETMMELVDFNDSKGIVNLHPLGPKDFTPVDHVDIPHSQLYLIADIDRGQKTLNIAPNEALPLILGEGRSPLTIDEGLAIITQYPEFLKKNNCFSLLASRAADKRVPAIWVSEKKPKLGWCWNGNPHTWLGSASCSKRVGF